jgi:hypothetical protein
MSIIIESKKVRPSTDIPWYQFAPSWNSLLSSYNITFVIEEPDVLTRVTTLTFPDQATYDTWSADPAVVKELNNLNNYLNFGKLTKEQRQISS